MIPTLSLLLALLESARAIRALSAYRDARRAERFAAAVLRAVRQ